MCGFKYTYNIYNVQITQSLLLHDPIKYPRFSWNGLKINFKLAIDIRRQSSDKFYDTWSTLCALAASVMILVQPDLCSLCLMSLDVSWVVPGIRMTPVNAETRLMQNSHSYILNSTIYYNTHRPSE